MSFIRDYEQFLDKHNQSRHGPGKTRIDAGLNHAENLFLQNVWWPAFGHFKGLHPEYEIIGFHGKLRYLDFAYIHSHFKIAIEIDGIGSHWKDVNQWKFADHCRRQNHLVIDGWHILRFAYIDVKEHPRECQQMVQQLIGRLSGNAGNADIHDLCAVDREIIRFVIQSRGPITCRDIAKHLHISAYTATRHLRYLAQIYWLAPASGHLRVHKYQLHESRTHVQL